MLEADSALLDVYRAWGLVVRVEFEGINQGWLCGLQPIVSIVVPFSGLTKYIKDPIR